MQESTYPSEKGTITLKLNNFSTYMTQIGQFIESPRQQVAGIEWHVVVYPSPSVDNDATCLWCFLVGVKANKWTAWVDATCRFVMLSDDKLVRRAYIRRKLMGKEPLLDDCGWFVTPENLTALNGLVVNDCVEIRVDFSVSDVCGASFNAFEAAAALAADVKLKVGDSVFFANKGYLSVVSSVFRYMFALTEAAGEGEKEIAEIELKDLDAGEFKEFLGAIYPTCYPVTDANVISLFRIAVRYDVKRVIGDCEYHLYGVNNVPWFDKLKLAVDLDRNHLKHHLISKMTRDGIRSINENQDKDQPGMDILQALLNMHIGVHHA
ncbi:Protein BATH-38 [Aphelenchoides avenae]|nr:Protein BATH-38 [Aphelenchus avenae]